MTLQVILAPVGVSGLYEIASYHVPGHIEKCPGSLEIGPTGTTITSIVVLVEFNWDSRQSTSTRSMAVRKGK